MTVGHPAAACKIRRPFAKTASRAFIHEARAPYRSRSIVIACAVWFEAAVPFGCSPCSRVVLRTASDNLLEPDRACRRPIGPRGRRRPRATLSDYWYPLYAFVRRQGYGPDDAGDLVQGFLADLLERRDLAAADPARGRFRSFLRAACVHFLAHHREHDRALKRGGGRTRHLD